MKNCPKCKKNKTNDEFYKNGHYCKLCKKECDREYYLKNKEKIKQRQKDDRVKNKEKHKKRDRRKYLKNKEKIKKRNIENYHNNKELYSKTRKKYYENNKKSILKQVLERKKNDLNFKLKCNLRSRLWQAIKSNQKSGSAVKDLGCSIKELKKHLESKFQPGMTWENYGLKGWHIDHIKPLSSFDLSDKKQLLEACNYKNLQPLWAEDNLQKSNKESTEWQ